MYILIVSKKFRSASLFYKDHIFDSEYKELSYDCGKFSFSYFHISRKRLAGFLYATRNNGCKVYFLKDDKGDRIFDYMSNKYWLQ